MSILYKTLIDSQLHS